MMTGPGSARTPDIPLLLVGHGTRSAAGVAQFRALVERIRHRPGAPQVVEGGFIELSPPPVQDAVRAVVEAGHRDLVAVPLVLAAAGHGKGDIPAAMARERARHPGLSYRYGRPLGPHPVLQDVVARRVDAALGLPDDLTQDEQVAARDGVHVVLVGRGSTDPDANAEVAKVARLLYEGRGYAGVELSFISLAEPGVPAALDRVRRLGSSRVVVAPYFLFPGVLPDRIQAQTLDFAARYPALDVRVADLVGDCDELADLALERYREALQGDIRMNCDTCAYRVALPGFTDKVGRPQRPHDHPDDPTHQHHHDHRHDHPHGSVSASPAVVPGASVAAVGDGDDLEQVAVGILPVDPSAAVVGVDLAGPPSPGVRPVREPAPPDPPEDRIEVGLVDEERVVLRDDGAVIVGIVE
jgi:sirohydrochlorin cobaltochelatase